MKMTIQALALAMLSLLLVTGGAQAVPVQGVYDAIVAVPDTSEAERSPAFARALERVLVKASGSEAVLQREGIADTLANAGSLVQAYRYQRSDAEPGAENELQLAVSFGAVGVTRALSSIGAPVWGANRPVVLAWVAVQSRAGRTLATSATAEGGSAESDGEGLAWGAAMARAARSKGVPVVLPDFDQKDQSIVSLSDIWGLFMAPIEQASETYRSDLLGVARISGGAQGFSARWALKGAGVALNGEVQGESRQAVADAVVAAWAEALAQRYAVKPGNEQSLQRVDVIISGVEDLQSYAQIRKSLAAMAPVSAAAPVRITDGSLRIRVEFNGELELLKEHLALEPRLQPIQPQANKGDLRAVSPTESAAGVASGATPGMMTSVQPAMGAPGEPGLGTVVPLDPTIQTIPGPGEPLDLFAEPAQLQESSEDFTSLYPLLYFKWASNPESARR